MFFFHPSIEIYRGRHLATLVPGDVAGVGAKLLDEVGGVFIKEPFPMFNRLEMYEDVLIWTFGTKFTFHLPSFFFV